MSFFWRQGPVATVCAVDWTASCHADTPVLARSCSEFRLLKVLTVLPGFVIESELRVGGHSLDRRYTSPKRGVRFRPTRGQDMATTSAEMRQWPWSGRAREF